MRFTRRATSNQLNWPRLSRRLPPVRSNLMLYGLGILFLLAICCPFMFIWIIAFPTGKVVVEPFRPVQHDPILSEQSNADFHLKGAMPVQRDPIASRGRPLRFNFEKRTKSKIRVTSEPKIAVSTVDPDIKLWESKMSFLWNDTESSDHCADIVGNSFRERSIRCSGEVSQIECRTDPNLQSSNCKLLNVKLDASKIAVAKGGEPIEEVWGQQESAEIPSFQKGSIQVQCKTNLKFGDHSALPHYLSDFMNGVAPVDELQCSKWENRTTVAITRYDYANMYHTSCGFYTFYQAIQVFGHRHSEIAVLLLDGHPQGALDEPWSTVFGQTYRVSQLRDEPVCFRELILANPEYRIQIFPGSRPGIHGCANNPFFEDFARYFRSKYDVQTPMPDVQGKSTVCYVFRRDYIAHPRQGERKASRKISNEDELIRAAAELTQVAKVIPLYFEKEPFGRQLHLVSQCDVLVGMHGAGLTHSLFMRPGSGMLEIAPSGYSHLDFFSITAHVKGIKYAVQHHGISGGGDSYHVDVTSHLNSLQTLL
jgi:hypothetical protein